MRRPASAAGKRRQWPADVPAGVHVITSVDEWRDYARRFGPPNAIDVGAGVFGAVAGGLFVDDFADGRPVAFGWPEVSPSAERLRAAIMRERPAAAASFALRSVDVGKLRAFLAGAERLRLRHAAAGARFLLAEIGRAKRRKAARARGRGRS